MSGRAFAAAAVVGLSVAAVSLVLASTMDEPLFAVAGTIVVVAVFAGREVWSWAGDARGGCG
jgi:hypothetical protein